MNVILLGAFSVLVFWHDSSSSYSSVFELMSAYMSFETVQVWTLFFNSANNNYSQCISFTFYHPAVYPTHCYFFISLNYLFSSELYIFLFFARQ